MICLKFLFILLFIILGSSPFTFGSKEIMPWSGAQSNILVPKDIELPNWCVSDDCKRIHEANNKKYHECLQKTKIGTNKSAREYFYKYTEKFIRQARQSEQKGQDTESFLKDAFSGSWWEGRWK